MFRVFRIFNAADYMAAKAKAIALVYTPKMPHISQ